MLRRLFSTTGAKLAKRAPKAKAQSNVNALLGRQSSKLSVGIVGLANVGKSTFFQAITKSSLGNPNNYPFATVDPEEAMYTVPSPKLEHLREIFGSEKTIPSYLKIVDIAGLVRNASKGEGLGNQFLNDIRNVDGIFHVVRGFDNDEITHVELTVDPVRDLEIVTDELLLKDLDTVESVLERNKKSMKSMKLNDRKEIEKENSVLQKLSDLMMENGRLLNNTKWTEDEVDVINKHKFLTAKPTVYLLNVSEEDYINGENKYVDGVKEWIDANSPKEKLIMFSADHEHSQLETQDRSDVINEMVTQMKNQLNLISFYTCGRIEAREWNVKRGSTAPEGAGMIHTDLQKGFLNASVLKYEKLLEKKDEVINGEVERCIKYDKHGKAYEIDDGDIMVINAVGAKTR
jgi:obg-like ATPase 1